VITPPITRGGAKGLPGGSDTLTTHNDGKEKGPKRVAAPTSTRGRSVALILSRREVCGFNTQQKGDQK
jgi:hypothetical protein